MGTLDGRGHYPDAITEDEIIYLRKLGGLPAKDGYITLAEARALILSAVVNLSVTGNLTTAGVIETTDPSPVTVAANPEVLSITGKTILQRRLRTAASEVFTMPNAATHNGRSFTLYIHQVLTGNPVATSATFTGVDWGAAGTFVVSNLNDKVDILTFICMNNKWYGMAGKGFGI